MATIQHRTCHVRKNNLLGLIGLCILTFALSYALLTITSGHNISPTTRLSNRNVLGLATMEPPKACTTEPLWWNLQVIPNVKDQNVESVSMSRSLHVRMKQSSTSISRSACWPRNRHRNLWDRRCVSPWLPLVWFGYFGFRVYIWFILKCLSDGGISVVFGCLIGVSNSWGKGWPMVAYPLRA